MRPRAWLMAGSLAATLDPERLLNLVRVHGVAPERLMASWRDLVTRVVRGRVGYASSGPSSSHMSFTGTIHNNLIRAQ